MLAKFSLYYVIYFTIIQAELEGGEVTRSFLYDLLTVLDVYAAALHTMHPATL